MSIIDRIKAWYTGKYVPPKNNPSSDLIFIIGHYERHWTASLARVIIEFYLREWKWFWGIFIAIVSVCIAFLTLSEPLCNIA